MLRPRLDAPVADEPPASDQLTDYDALHVIHYVILPDAEQHHVAWENVAHEALLIDPAKDPARARRAYETHLIRTKWTRRATFSSRHTGGTSDAAPAQAPRLPRPVDRDFYRHHMG